VGQFYSNFHNLADCFAAYDAEAERLCTALVDAAGAASGWREGTPRADLTELFRFAAERLLVARALLCEVHVAGGDAFAKHDEVLERLTAAIGSRCQEAVEATIAPIPMAPAFTAGA
jgi:hypothetical protein